MKNAMNIARLATRRRYGGIDKLASIVLQFCEAGFTICNNFTPTRKDIPL